MGVDEVCAELLRELKDHKARTGGDPWVPAAAQPTPHNVDVDGLSMMELLGKFDDLVDAACGPKPSDAATEPACTVPVVHRDPAGGVMVDAMEKRDATGAGAAALSGLNALLDGLSRGAPQGPDDEVEVTAFSRTGAPQDVSGELLGCLKDALNGPLSCEETAQPSAAKPPAAAPLGALADLLGDEVEVTAFSRSGAPQDVSGELLGHLKETPGAPQSDTPLKASDDAVSCLGALLNGTAGGPEAGGAVEMSVVTKNGASHDVSGELLGCLKDALGGPAPCNKASQPALDLADLGDGLDALVGVLTGKQSTPGGSAAPEDALMSLTSGSAKDASSGVEVLAFGKDRKQAGDALPAGPAKVPREQAGIRETAALAAQLGAAEKALIAPRARAPAAPAASLDDDCRNLIMAMKQHKAATGGDPWAALAPDVTQLFGAGAPKAKDAHGAPSESVEAILDGLDDVVDALVPPQTGAGGAAPAPQGGEDLESMLRDAVACLNRTGMPQ